MRLFVAYPSKPEILTQSIRTAVTNARQVFPRDSVVSWEEDLTPGSFIGTNVLLEISRSTALVADVTLLNFNVLYEIGYAIGVAKPVLLTVNRALESDADLRREVGLIDTLLYQSYENSDQLLALMRSSVPQDPLPLLGEINSRQPIYLMETRYKTDFSTTLASRIRKAKLNPRVFDASEEPRMSGPKTLQAVLESYGVVVHLANDQEKDAKVHNLRAAFLIGLANGLDRVLLPIQQGESPVPLDYIDLVKSCKHPSDIQDAVGEFAAAVLERLTEYDDEERISLPETLIQRMDLGASAAENEFRRLGAYYLETEEYRKVSRGEARLVVGRKGTGKSALFFHLRNIKRQDKRDLILDLKPEGFQLRKLRDLFNIALGEGTYEHTLIAFWDYLLRMEIARGMLDRDSTRHKYNHLLFEPYRELEKVYAADGSFSAGSFSERLATLINRVAGDLKARISGGDKAVYLSEPEITELVYGADFYKLEDALSAYLKEIDGIWILFDNLDKGWPAYGLDDADIMIVRTLLGATRKIERWVSAKIDVECNAVVFLRNDVYELLIEGTPDRGKESKVLLDWTDADVMRELLRRRMVKADDVPRDSKFDTIWRRICVPLYDAEESSQYLIDRCLMRPRFLLDLIGHCKSFAVNLGHSSIEADDISKGLQAYSNDVLTDVSLELRDVAPYAEDVLYCFIGAPRSFDLDFVISAMRANDFQLEHLDSIVELLLWYGFFGILAPGAATSQYIYDVNYRLKTLLALRRQHSKSGLRYSINPAFWPVLQIQ